MDEEKLLIEYTDWLAQQNIHSLASRHVSPSYKSAFARDLIRRYLRLRPAPRVTYGKKPCEWLERLVNLGGRPDGINTYIDIFTPKYMSPLCGFCDWEPCKDRCENCAVWYQELSPELRYPRSEEEYILWM